MFALTINPGSDPEASEYSTSDMILRDHVEGMAERNGAIVNWDDDKAGATIAVPAIAFEARIVITELSLADFIGTQVVFS